ncbi:hypothetical protein SDJN02_00963, partial [Cucurbita argyrosperma subsp. argyrosperma]
MAESRKLREEAGGGRWKGQVESSKERDGLRGRNYKRSLADETVDAVCVGRLLGCHWRLWQLLPWHILTSHSCSATTLLRGNGQPSGYACGWSQKPANTNQIPNTNYTKLKLY